MGLILNLETATTNCSVSISKDGNLLAIKEHDTPSYSHSEQLHVFIQDVLKDAEIGTVTEPLLTPAGWYIFQVNERVDGHMYTFEELKDNLRQVVEGEKIEIALAEYVEELKERFFIDEKI